MRQNPDRRYVTANTAATAAAWSGAIS